MPHLLDAKRARVGPRQFAATGAAVAEDSLSS
jgi:hypothetical protein